MNIQISKDRKTSGALAAEFGAQKIRDAIASKGRATIIVASAASQFDMLDTLINAPDIDWSKITGFHLDEYIGLPIAHPASFRGYLWQRFHRRLPLPLKAFHYIDAETDAQAECARLSRLISEVEVDVCFAGIGENAHLAFNDPPADFETQVPYRIVDLDEACRKQQLGEGWFPTLEAVPTRAISMSIQQILKTRTLVLTVPDERKAKAVQASVEGEVTNTVPASILQQHADAHLYLDEPAASLLRR